MSKTEQILKDRGQVYGDYLGGSVFRATIMQLIEERYRQTHNKINEMPYMYKVMLSDIVYKISRLSVTPEHLDSWQDIAGYAELAYSAIRNSPLVDNDEEEEFNL